MTLLDAHVLACTSHQGAAGNPRLRAWRAAAVALVEPFGISDLLLGKFVRAATRPRVVDPPAPTSVVPAFAAGGAVIAGAAEGGGRARVATDAGTSRVTGVAAAS